MLQLQAQQVVWGVNPRRGRFSIETPLENADKKFIGERIEKDSREAVRTSRSTGTFLMQWEEICRHFLSVFFLIIKQTLQKTDVLYSKMLSQKLTKLGRSATHNVQYSHF